MDCCQANYFTDLFMNRLDSNIWSNLEILEMGFFNRVRSHTLSVLAEHSSKFEKLRILRLKCDLESDSNQYKSNLQNKLPSL